MLLSIAWKNIWRNKTRSLIIMTAIALGLSGGLISMAINVGMVDQMVKSAILAWLSHIQIHNPGFARDRDTDFTVPNAMKLTEGIGQIGGVHAASPRVVVTAMASSPVTATGVQIFGIEPAREADVSVIDQSIRQGTYFKSNFRNPVIIGEKLSEVLDIDIGSKLVLTFQNDSGEITGGAFRVEGIFKTVSSDFDKGNVFVKAEDLWRLLGSDSIYQEIAVLLENSNALDSVQNRIKLLAPEMKVDTWKTLAPELEYSTEVMGSTLYIFMAVILLALAFGIVNTMLMVVLERRRELGVLMSVGMSRKSVFWMIVLETVVLSVTAAFCGMLITAVAMLILSNTGINLSYFATGLQEFGVSEILYPLLPWSMYFILTVMVIVTAVLAAVYPALKAIRLRPAEALRM